MLDRIFNSTSQLIISDIVDGVNIGDAPNNYYNAYTVVDGSVVEGHVGGNDNYDYYKFVAPSDGELTISLTGLSSDIDLYLLNSNGSTLYSSLNWGTSGEYISYDVTAGQTYYIKVDPYLSSESDYNLNIEFEGQTLTSGDIVDGVNIGDAPNNYYNAYTVVDGSVVEGHVGGNDNYDYYKFVAPSDGELTISLTGLSSDIDLYLLNSNGSTLYSSLNWGTSGEYISYDVTAGQTYYIKVDPYLSSESDYNLNIEFEGQTLTSGDIVDGVNIGDAPNNYYNAYTVVDGSVVEGHVGGNDNYDYYKFVAPSDGELTISLTGLSSDIDLYLLNSNGSTLYSSLNWGTSGEYISYDVTAGQTYYIKVDPYLSSESDYNLNIEFEGQTLTSGDIVDGVNIGDAPNNYYNAYTVVDGSVVEGHVGGNDNYDYYKFVAPSDGELTISLTGLSSDIDLYLLNSNGSTLYSSLNWGTSGEYISYDVTAGQTYYIKVDPYLSSESDYNLNIEFEGQTLTSGDIVDGVNIGDAPNNYYNAYTVVDGSVVEGHVGGNDNYDYYKFVAPSDGELTISLTGLSSDIDLYLLNSNGSTLYSSLNWGTSGEYISYDVTAGQTYYIKVDPYLSSESDYNLNIEFEGQEISSESNIEIIDLSQGPSSLEDFELTPFNVIAQPLTWKEAVMILTANEGWFENWGDEIGLGTSTFGVGTSLISLLGLGGAAAAALPVAGLAAGLIGLGMSIADWCGYGLDLGGDTDIITKAFNYSGDKYLVWGCIFPGEEPAYLEYLSIKFDKSWLPGDESEVWIPLPSWQEDDIGYYNLPDESDTGDDNYAPYNVLLNVIFEVPDGGEYQADDIEIGFIANDGTADYFNLGEATLYSSILV